MSSLPFVALPPPLDLWSTARFAGDRGGDQRQTIASGCRACYGSWLQPIVQARVLDTYLLNMFNFGKVDRGHASNPERGLVGGKSGVGRHIMGG